MKNVEINLKFSEKLKVTRRSFFYEIRAAYEDLVLDPIDRFFIKRLPRRIRSYETRGNVVQRLNGGITREDYEALLNKAEDASAFVASELEKRKAKK